MAADLKCRAAFQRASVVLTADSLLKLEHAYTQDRVYRCNYDRIQSVIFWSRVPTARLVLAIITVLIGGAVFLITGSAADTVSQISSAIAGTVLVVIGGIYAFRFLVYKYTTIRITRASAPMDIEGIFSTKKLRTFRENLLFNIRTAQNTPKSIDPAAQQPAIQTTVDESNLPPFASIAQDLPQQTVEGENLPPLS